MERDKKVSPKEIFQHLLAIIALYASGISFLVLVFQYINILFPDAIGLDGYDTLAGARQAIRWSISSLVVVFPVYVFMTRLLNKSYAASPSKRNLRIRKWLIYFTLFATALIIIGDLVTLINNFLGGELTVRFLLKVLAVFVVTGSVMGYYIWELKRWKTEE